MKYYIVDAFTDQPFGGNPAGVVLLSHHDFPNEKLMLQIAAELRYSETAFIQQNAEKEFTIRYFTPVDEVELCGHATIASFGMLFQEGFLKEGDRCLYHTRAGDLNAIAGQKVMMQMAAPKLLKTLHDKDLSLRLYSIMGTKQTKKLPLPQIVSTGLPDIILPIADVETLQSLCPDMAALSLLSEQLQVTGVHAFAFGDDGFTAHVRNFAPLYDIPEESATGTANAALTYYLRHNGFIPVSAQCSFLQGEAMKRPSIVATTIEEKDGVCDIWVGGESKMIAKGDLL